MTAQAKVQSADAEFDAIFLAYHDRLYGLLYRLVGNAEESADLVQEVFLRLYQTPPSRQENNIGAWLYRVATNLGYNALRQRKRQARYTHQLLITADDSADPLAQLLLAEERTAVRRVLATLTLQQSQLLLLRHLGLSYAELATVCQINPQSVGTLLARATQLFRQRYLAQRPTT